MARIRESYRPNHKIERRSLNPTAFNLELCHPKPSTHMLTCRLWPGAAWWSLAEGDWSNGIRGWGFEYKGYMVGCVCVVRG